MQEKDSSGGRTQESGLEQEPRENETDVEIAEELLTSLVLAHLVGCPAGNERELTTNWQVLSEQTSACYHHLCEQTLACCVGFEGLSELKMFPNGRYHPKTCFLDS